MDILLTGPFTTEQLAAVRAAAPGAHVHHADLVAEHPAVLAAAEIVAGALSADELAQAGGLKWLHSCAAGPDTQLFPAFLAHPATLTCSKGSGGIPLAERAMLLMLMLQHGTLRSLEAQAARRWDFFFHGELAGKTLGIIGAGHCGLDLARKGAAFGMRVVGLRRTAVATAHFDRMYRRDELHAFLSESDFVVVTAPRTSETEAMLDAAAFAAMKSGAIYVCVSRGGIADDDALLAALRSGHLRGAGLDAHATEPLPEDSPFWAEPNVIIGAHNGATTPENRVRRHQIFLDNLRRYIAGQPLQNVVDKQAGY